MELMTVAGKLKKAATAAVLKLVPTINASTIEARYEVTILVDPAAIAKIISHSLEKSGNYQSYNYDLKHRQPRDSNVSI